jgi:hypothetical protein
MDINLCGIIVGYLDMDLKRSFVYHHGYDLWQSCGLPSLSSFSELVSDSLSPSLSLSHYCYSRLI